jgi:hypothetical protein
MEWMNYICTSHWRLPLAVPHSRYHIPNTGGINTKNLMSDKTGGWSIRNPTLPTKLYHQVVLGLLQELAQSAELKNTYVNSRYLSLFKDMMHYKGNNKLTWGGVIWTLSFPPTNNRTVDVNLVFVFITCGGCFSIMNVLQYTNNQKINLHDQLKSWSSRSATSASTTQEELQTYISSFIFNLWTTVIPQYNTNNDTTLDAS